MFGINHSARHRIVAEVLAVEMSVDIIIVDSLGGVCRERLWQDIPEDERQIIREKLTDKAMGALGYARAPDED